MIDTTPLLMLAITVHRASHTFGQRLADAVVHVVDNRHDDRGQATTEYALVLLAAALVAPARRGLGDRRRRGGPGQSPVQPGHRLGDRQGMTVRTPRRPRRQFDERGQAAVEFAVALPIVVVAMLAVAQVGVAVRNEVAVELAAREGARAAAVSADPSAAGAAARRAVDLPMEVAVSVDATTVSVTVTYVDPTDIAIIGAAIGPVTHTATATMAIEPP